MLSRFAGIGAGMAIERAAKRETALMRMDVVFIFFFFSFLFSRVGRKYEVEECGVFRLFGEE